MDLRRFLVLGVLAAAVAVFSGCVNEDPKTPDGLVMYGYKALSKKDVVSFQGTLAGNPRVPSDPLNVYGNVNGMSRINQELQGFELRPTKAVKKTSPSSEFDRYQTTISGRLTSKDKYIPLVGLVVDCPKKGLCLVSRVELSSCVLISTSEMMVKSAFTFLSHDDVAGFSETLDGDAQDVFGQIENMISLKNTLKGLDVIVGKPGAETELWGIHPGQPQKPIVVMDAAIACGTDPQYYCATKCRITALQVRQ